MFSLLFIVNVFNTSEGNIFSYPIPTEEKYLEPDKITEEEKSLFPEFFEGRIAKTPDRFLKIRNYILECWYVYFSIFGCIIIISYTVKYLNILDKCLAVFVNSIHLMISTYYTCICVVY